MEIGENVVYIGVCVNDGEEYERVDDFVCLGSTISAKGQLTKKVKAVDRFSICQTPGSLRRYIHTLK